MDKIVARYRWTIEELTKGLRWHYRHTTRPFFRGALWVLIILICMGGIGILVFSNTWDGAIVTAIGFLMLLSMAAGTPWLARRQFRQNPNQNAEIEWRLSPEIVQIIGPHSSTQAEWSAISKVVQTPDGLLLYFAPQFFHWIPRNGFATEAEFDSAIELSRKNCQQFVKVGKSPIIQRFRFRVRNLLWTTFWVCIWAAALSHLITFVRNHRPLQGLPWWILLTAVWLPVFIVVWTPAIAIGALFNRTRHGAVIGLIIAAILVAMALAIII